jgi:BirA family transcriptional regulator, biotin operon repressor / biotin---[acetyl-CoA-carboxylase] ligase
MSSIDIAKLKSRSWLSHVEWHDEVASTQDIARELAMKENAPIPFLIGADLQTAGRGRGTNRWWTGSGALACTLAINTRDLGGAGQTIPQLSLAVGLSLVHAVKSYTAGHIVGVHWPNDIYCQSPDGQSRKLAGILIEALPDGRVIIGVGLNTNNSLRDAPIDLQQRVITLSDIAGELLDQTELLINWLDELQAAIRLLFSNPQEIGLQFERYSLQIGKTITITTGSNENGQVKKEFTGVCDGITDDGALLLLTSEGLKTFYSGTLNP